MKAFTAAALATVAAASAAPEAEPWLVAPAIVPINPHATTGELVTLPNGAQVPDTTVSVKAAAADHLNAKAAAYGYGLPLAGLWKREADADAEPWVPYGLGAWGLGLKSAPCVNALNIPVPCRGKREAEAKPWLVTPAIVPINPHATTGELVTLPNGAQVPDTTASVKAAAADHLNAKAAAYGYGLPLAGLWKREADAEAEPWLGYGLGGWGLAGVAGPKSAPCVNAWNVPVPCGLGKREAEAEPWLGYAPYPYAVDPAVGSPVAGLVAHPNGAVTPPHTPAVQAAAADHLATKAATYGLPLAGIWKREADAEAEPWLGYGLGWGYAGLKSAPCVNAWNVPVPC